MVSRGIGLPDLPSHDAFESESTDNALELLPGSQLRFPFSRRKGTNDPVDIGNMDFAAVKNGQHVGAGSVGRATAAASRKCRHKEQSRQLAELGFELEPFGAHTVNVTGIPALLGDCRVRQLLRDTLEELEELAPGASWRQARDSVLGRMACHASVRAGQELAEPQVRALLEQLEQVDHGGTCPHGRPVLVEFTRQQVGGWFGRS